MSHRLRVATYNLHAGVDGWGRRTDVVGASVDLDADVLFVQESWRTDGEDVAADIAARSGAVAHSFALAAGYRVTGGTGTSNWQSRAALFTGNQGIFLDSERPLSTAATRLLEAARGVQRGEWCVGVVTKLPVIDVATLELPHLTRDRARRLLVCVTVSHATGPLRCFSLHGAHLSHGSIGQYRALTTDVDAQLADGARAVLGGDLNCWGVVARRVLRGWRQAARGATWPSWRPHSQLDHLFVRGNVGVVEGRVVDRRESDHRPVLATLELR